MTPQKLLTRMAAAVVAAAAMPWPEPEEEESFIGLWITADGSFRQELRPDGRYVEMRGRRECAGSGRYMIIGRHIEYRDDSGLAAEGDFLNEDVLRHGSMVLHRRW